MKQEVEEEIKIKAKQVANNLVSFMKELDTEANKQIKELELDIEYYKSKIEELEQQIEKMKCCYNCFYDCEDCNSKNKDCDKCPCGTCVKHNHWELRK